MITDEAIDAVFEEFGELATYTPANGDPQTITVRRESIAIKTGPFFSGGMGIILDADRQPGACNLLARVAEFADPPDEGDVIVLGARRYMVRAVPEIVDFAVWRLSVVETP